MKKTVLITGAAGFLGSHLCDFFIKKNYKVIGIDNLSTGEIKNLDHLKNNINFNFLKLDITCNFELNEKIHYVLHFASPASPIDYLKMPLETLRAGSIGTENILKIALKNKSTILIASTSEIYGDPLEHPQNEEYYGNVNTVGPRSVYDEAKRFQETITYTYHNQYNLNIRIARIFNTYGPRMRLNDGRALPTFIRQALKNQPVTVFGDGQQTRSFCYVDDLILGLYSLLKSNYKFPINLGNPDEITVLDFAKEIIALTESKSKIIFKNLPQNDPIKRKPSIKKANKIINWKPEITRKTGLKKTLKYYKSL